MPVCSKCGTNYVEGDRFCMVCGNSFGASNEKFQTNQLAVKPNSSVDNPLPKLVPYNGQARTFTLSGETYNVSEGMDAFIHYRKAFKHAAKYMADFVMRDYDAQVRNLDDYFTKFPIMYVHYRRYLVDEAVKILIHFDIYDISREEFEAELGKEFSKCNVTYEALIEAFNNTITDNQARAARRGSLLPNIFFGGGVLGFAQALAYNAASTAIVESSIRNANVSQAQRRELFKRITRKELYENLLSDYWDVHYSLTYRLHENGVNVWYPSVEGNTKAQGLMRNLQSNLIPEEKKAKVLVQVLNNRPMQDGCVEYLVKKFGKDPEAMAIAEYLGLEDEMGV